MNTFTFTCTCVCTSIHIYVRVYLNESSNVFCPGVSKKSQKYNFKKNKKITKQNSQQKEISQTKSTKAKCEIF